MAITYLSKERTKVKIFKILSTDGKDAPPTDSVGSILFETDTGNVFEWSGSAWYQIRSGGLVGSTDFYTEVKKGSVTGHSLVSKFGRNDSVPNGSWAFVNQLGHTAWQLSAATTVRIKSGGNAADTAAGAGAREVTVQGIDSNGDEVTEAIATAGASASSVTTASFWRVHRAWVSAAGTYGSANTGNIVIENGAGGTDLIQITADEGQSQFGGYTIASGYTAYLNSVNVTVDGLKAADIRVFTRDNITDTTAPVSAKRIKLYFDGILGSFVYRPGSPILVLSGLTDIWVEARGGGALTEVSSNLELLLVAD